MTINQRRKRAWRRRTGRVKLPIPPQRLAELLVWYDSLNK